MGWGKSKHATITRVRLAALCVLAPAFAAACGAPVVPALAFHGPRDGQVVCTPDDAVPATPPLDVRVVVRATGLRDGTLIVLENQEARTSSTRPLAGGEARFVTPLAPGRNRLFALTADCRTGAVPPVTVIAHPTAPAVSFVQPVDGAELGPEDDLGGDSRRGFQCRVEIRAAVENGQEAELNVSGMAEQPMPAVVMEQRAVFPNVALPPGGATLTVNVQSACGNQGSAAARVTWSVKRPPRPRRR